MPIRFTCSHCGSIYKIPDDTGSTIECKYCRNVVPTNVPVPFEVPPRLRPPLPVVTLPATDGTDPATADSEPCEQPGAAFQLPIAPTEVPPFEHAPLDMGALDIPSINVVPLDMPPRDAAPLDIDSLAPARTAPAWVPPIKSAPSLRAPKAPPAPRPTRTSGKPERRHSDFPTLAWILGGAVVLMLILTAGTLILYSKSQSRMVPHASSTAASVGSDPPSPPPAAGTTPTPDPAPKVLQETVAVESGKEKSRLLLPLKTNWDVGLGQVRIEQDKLVVDNDGGRYWLVSKEPLPDDFKVSVKCSVTFLEGRQKLQPSQREFLRTLTVHFGGADTSQKDQSGDGAYVRFSHALLHLYRGGKIVKTVPVGMPAQAFTLTITKKGVDTTIEVDGQVLMSYHDDQPFSGSHKFSIGGYLSRLHLGEVSIGTWVSQK